MRAPRGEGEEAAYSTLGQEHCLQDRGHSRQFLCGFPRGSSRRAEQQQWRDEQVLQGDLQPREPLN